MNCEFSDPIDLGSGDFEYSKFSCVFTEGENPISLIQSGSSEGHFYINPSITYGDTIIFVFLSLFIIAIICKSIGDFIFNKD